MIKMPPRPGKALEEAVSLWLEVGSLAPLEHAVFAGYGQLLEGRTSRIPKVNAFLKKVPQYQGRIARVHEAATDGNLTQLALLLDRPEWGVSRDDSGSTPVQKAMLASHLSVVRFLLHKAPNSLTASDRMGRTPLHYAAALDAVNQGSGGAIGVSWYQVLTEAGAPEDVEDLLGRTPNFYREYCGELLLREDQSGDSSAPDTRTPSPLEEDSADDLVFHVTVEIREDDRDRNLIFEI